MTEELAVPRRLRIAVFATVSLFAVTLDLVSKDLAARRLGTPDGRLRIEVLEGVLGYRYVTNTGIVFGSFRNLGPLFTWVAAAAVPVIVVVFLRLKKPTPTVTLALAFILGGAIGNLYDRARFGHVRDFIDFYLIRWPVFNLADSFILVGVLLLLLEMTLLEETKPPAEKRA